MLRYPPSVRVFVCTVATDMRRSCDGLAMMATSVVQQDPLSGHLFVFINRRRDRVKVLWWDDDGLAIFFGSDRGGKAAATPYSLVQTCKRHGIDPFEYLRDVFTRISGLPVSRLSELLPDRWKALRDQAKQTLLSIPSP